MVARPAQFCTIIPSAMTHIDIRRAVFVAVVASALMAGSIVRADGVPFHNVHLTVADPVQAAQWYITNLGGTPAPEFNTPAMFGRMMVVFVKGAAEKGSAGSAVDHIGFSFPEETKGR